MGDAMPSMVGIVVFGTPGPHLHGFASCSAGKAGAYIHACPPAAVPLAHVRAFGTTARQCR